MGSSTPATKYLFAKFRDDSSIPVAIFEGDVMTLEHGHAVVWATHHKLEIVGITSLGANESIKRAPRMQAEEVRSAFVKKAQRKKGRNPYDAVRPTKREMVALARDRESETRRSGVN
jgi:hypothetical protein